MLKINILKMSASEKIKETQITMKNDNKFFLMYLSILERREEHEKEGTEEQRAFHAGTMPSKQGDWCGA